MMMIPTGWEMSSMAVKAFLWVSEKRRLATFIFRKPLRRKKETLLTKEIMILQILHVSTIEIIMWLTTWLPKQC